jgi:hypothetical protein
LLIMNSIRLGIAILTRQGIHRSSTRTRGLPDRPLEAALAICLVAAACGSEVEPSRQVGEVAVPEAVAGSMPEPQWQVLADLVAFATAVAHAEIEALGEPIARRAVDRSRVAVLPRLLAFQRLGFDEGTLRTAYRDRPEWELVVRHVVLLTDETTPPAHRDSLRALAEEVAARAHAGEDFAALAARFSQEPGAAERGGRLQPGRRGSWVDPFWNAAIGLQPGQISGVVESPYGFHVLRLDERRTVPFEEADRADLLRWVIQPGAAAAAMEEWMASDGRIDLNLAAAAEAGRRLVSGSVPAPDIVLATSAAGIEYRGFDFAAGWATLSADERLRLERDGERFQEWLLADAREWIWARQAERIGAEPRTDALSEGRAEWRRRAIGWADALGFHASRTDAEIVSTAVQALLSGTPGARTARAELRSLRPLLRLGYPAADHAD